jgi:hypothetical protein
VLQLEVLIGELFAVNRSAPGAIAIGEVASLDHEFLDHSVEDAARVTFLYEKQSFSLINAFNSLTPFGRFESSMKFSTVFGTVLPKSPISMRPTSSLPILMSK